MHLKHESCNPTGDRWGFSFVAGQQLLRLVLVIADVEHFCWVVPINSASKVPPKSDTHRRLFRRGESEFSLESADYWFQSADGSRKMSRREFVYLDCADDSARFYLENIYFGGVQ